MLLFSIRQKQNDYTTTLSVKNPLPRGRGANKFLVNRIFCKMRFTSTFVQRLYINKKKWLNRRNIFFLTQYCKNFLCKTFEFTVGAKFLARLYGTILRFQNFDPKFSKYFWRKLTASKSVWEKYFGFLSH